MVLLHIRSVYGRYRVQIIVKIEVYDTEIFGYTGSHSARHRVCIRSRYGPDTPCIGSAHGLYRGRGTRKFQHRGHILRVIGSGIGSRYGHHTVLLGSYRVRIGVVVFLHGMGWGGPEGRGLPLSPGEVSPQTFSRPWPGEIRCAFPSTLPVLRL